MITSCIIMEVRRAADIRSYQQLGCYNCRSKYNFSRQRDIHGMRKLWNFVHDNALMIAGRDVKVWFRRNYSHTHSTAAPKVNVSTDLNNSGTVSVAKSEPSETWSQCSAVQHLRYAEKSLKYRAQTTNLEPRAPIPRLI